MNQSVSIATKPLVYSAFRYISNKVYNALAEYVDNSIQSFMDHRELLSQLNSSRKLSVFITIDVDHDIITIRDDAFGISASNYDRAFELANIPLDASGLNEFGMGMKVSSIWLSNLWSVETSAYGEPVRKTLVFDLEEVVRDEKVELDVQTVPAKASDHYTLITLRKLSQNKPSSRQISHIKKHLASIYTKFIREGVLDLYVNDELLQITEPKILNAPYYKDVNSPSILWRKEINFSFPKYVAGAPVENYRVSGYIGVLETMSTSIDNGFLLFRRGRVIGSSYEDRYRPKALCGEEGSPRYKRVFGELELEGFNVSFTKNSFVEDDDFDTFISLLKEDIANDKSFDIFGQAQFYKKPVNVVTTKVATNLNTKLVKAFNNTKVNSTTHGVFPTQDENQLVDINGQQQDETLFSEPIANPQVAKITIDSCDFNLEIGHVRGGDPSWLYNLVKVGDGHYKTEFNLRNPFFERFNDVFSSDDGYLPVATFIKAMVSSEIMLINGGDNSGGTFRNMFNKIFGQIG